MAITEELKDMHIARYNMYNFCRNLFEMVPGEDFYKMLNEMLPHLEVLAKGDNEDIKIGVNGILDFLTQYNSKVGLEKSDFELEVSRAYTSVLCIPGVAPQVESIYTSKEGLTCQESRDEMLALFDKYSVELPDTIHQDYDHLFSELAFMAYLIKSTYDAECEYAYEGLIVEQLEMHVNHFDKWIYSFLDKLGKASVSEVKLYVSISHFVKGFLQEDKAYLEEELN